MRNIKVFYFTLLLIAFLVLLLIGAWYYPRPTAREMIRADDEVYAIVSDLVDLKTGYSRTIFEDSLDASLNSAETARLNEGLNEARMAAERFQNLFQQGMMNRVALINISVKYCIAESIIGNNFNVCNVENNPEIDVIGEYWNGSKEDIDYWVSAEQVMPYFLAGYLNNKVGNGEKTDVQFQKIREYQSYLLTTEESMGPSPSGPLFAKIYSKMMKLSE